MVEQFVRWRWIVVPGYLDGLRAGPLAGRVAGWAPSCSPRSIRASSCSGSGRPPGSNFELTREMAVKCLEEIERRGEAREHRDHDGLTWARSPPTSASTTCCSSCAGPTTASCASRSRESSGIKLAEFRERLRKVLPERVIPWMAERLEQGGLSKEKAEQQAKTVDLRFRAGRYRDRGHELRLADADRGPGRRHRSEPGPAARGEDRRRDEDASRSSAMSSSSRRSTTRRSRSTSTARRRA